jgi:hypothetical protein
MFGGRLGIPEILLIMILLLVPNILLILAWWRIFTKAGHPGVIGVAMAIPVLNLGILLWFAFSKWPIENQAPVS